MKNVLLIAAVAAMFAGCARHKSEAMVIQASPCSVAKVGAIATIHCPDGSSSSVIDGQPGQIGQPGQDATPVTVVQFCPGMTPSYPTVFPEYGFCVSGKLYAVYWDGVHAFLALLTPGRYESTSPQWCTFTVQTNCAITN